MKYSKAIVRQPAAEMIHGLTEAKLGSPDYNIALTQHKKYVETLVNLGLDVMTLGPDPRYPDSTFVEDAAVVCESFGMITRPGAVTRRGEVLEIEFVLHRYYKNLEYIYSPGFLDGGDVLQVDKHFFIGLSKRTNKNGAQQLLNVAQKNGMTGSVIAVDNLLHLKSGVSFLGDNHLLVVEALYGQEEFQSFDLIKIPKEESYAANCVSINGKVLVPAGFPKTEKRIKDAGFETTSLAMSEFRKLDGGLSCLSLRL